MNTDFKHLDLFTPEGFRKLYDACYESLAVYAVRMTANSEAAEDISSQCLSTYGNEAMKLTMTPTFALSFI